MAQSKPPKISLEARTQIELSREVARNDMALGLSGLFRVTGDRQRREVTMRQEWNGGVVILQGVECNEYDLGVLLAILSLAMRDGETKSAAEAPTKMIEDRRRSNLALEKQVIVVSTTKAAICRTVGVSADGDSWNAVSRSIRRLMSLVIEGRKKNRRATTHLIHSSQEEGCELSITVSPRLASAVLGDTSYAAVSMQAYRALKTGPAKILYAWLSSWFGGATGARKIGADKLEQHVYGDNATERSTRSRRKKAIAASAEAISQCGEFVLCLDAETGMWIVARTRGTDNPATKGLITPQQ